MKIQVEINNPFKGLIANRKARKEAIRKIKKMSASEIAQIGLTETKKVESDKATETTEKIQEATKPKVDSDVFRYFLQDESKKGVCSAQIKRLCGNKAIWQRAKTGKKNLYVSGIENMPSDKVDEVMKQFKNLDTYFVKSPYKAKIWSKS